MAFTDTTSPRGIQLPHPSNKLSMDVARLRAALQQVDDLITALQTGKVGLVNGKTGVSITLKPKDIGLGPADGPSLISLSYDASGRVTSIQDTYGVGDVATSNVEYGVDGKVSTVMTLYAGESRLETFGYDASGKLETVTGYITIMAPAPSP